jgi:hypothetical protein
VHSARLPGCADRVASQSGAGWIAWEPWLGAEAILFTLLLGRVKIIAKALPTSAWNPMRLKTFEKLPACLTLSEDAVIFWASGRSEH